MPLALQSIAYCCPDVLSACFDEKSVDSAGVASTILTVKPSGLQSHECWPNACQPFVTDAMVSNVEQQ